MSYLFTDEQMLCYRLADAAIDIYAMICVTSRYGNFVLFLSTMVCQYIWLYCCDLTWYMHVDYKEEILSYLYNSCMMKLMNRTTNTVSNLY